MFLAAKAVRVAPQLGDEVAHARLLLPEQRVDCALEGGAVSAVVVDGLDLLPPFQRVLHEVRLDLVDLPLCSLVRQRIADAVLERAQLLDLVREHDVVRDLRNILVEARHCVIDRIFAFAVLQMPLH